MAMISYAQNHEDVLLQRVFPRDHQGYYIDVGAADPLIHSVTKHFYEQGWHGINVEPLPECYRKLAADRPRDVNLNVGLSNVPGRFTFYEMPACSEWSTFSASRAAEIRAGGGVLVEHELPVLTLADLCAEHVRGPIDFLKIDVECHEKAVLEGGDWTRWRPRVVLLEAPAAGEVGPHCEWEPILLDNRYLFAAFDGLNRYYVRSEDRGLIPGLRIPVNVQDDYTTYGFEATLESLRATVASWRDIHARYEGALRELNGVREQLHELSTRYAPAIRMAQKVERVLERSSARFPRTTNLIRKLLRKVA
jgi:FkbM family methyltransferase